MQRQNSKVEGVGREVDRDKPKPRSSDTELRSPRCNNSTGNREADRVRFLFFGDLGVHRCFLLLLGGFVRILLLFVNIHIFLGRGFVGSSCIFRLLVLGSLLGLAIGSDVAVPNVLWGLAVDLVGPLRQDVLVMIGGCCNLTSPSASKRAHDQ